MQQLIGPFEYPGNDFYRNVFGVLWDKLIDKDIGNTSELLLPEPELSNFRFPDPLDDRFLSGIETAIEQKPVICSGYYKCIDCDFTIKQFYVAFATDTLSATREFNTTFVQHIN